MNEKQRLHLTISMDLFQRLTSESSTLGITPSLLATKLLEEHYNSVTADYGAILQAMNEDINNLGPCTKTFTLLDLATFRTLQRGEGTTVGRLFNEAVRKKQYPNIERARDETTGALLFYRNYCVYRRY